MSIRLQPARQPATDEARLAVLNIQRTCVHDGPGLRTTVFFRGCPMRCRWCHNPEAQAFRTPSSRSSDRTVAEIIEVVARDAAYFRSSHGGLTLSGGEPLAQGLPSLLALLEQARQAGISVAVETAGDVPWRVFEACLPLVDLFLFDLKIVGDDALHRELTGRPSQRIHRNLERLFAAGAPVRARLCVVPGLTDGAANLAATADLLSALGQPEIELMRYHDLHEQKASDLALPSPKPLDISAEQSLHALDRASQTLRERGIEVSVAPTEAGRAPVVFPERVQRIRRAIRDAGHALCLESAELKTTFHKKHRPRRAPLAVQRAEQLRYLLTHKQLNVHPDELLVGNFTAKRVGGHIWVEYFGVTMAANLWQIDRQTPVPFDCSLADKLRFYARIVPYWLPRCLFARAFPKPGQLAAFAGHALTKKAGFNNNLSGIAHFIVNGERLLRLGTRGIAREVEQARQCADDSGFHHGVLIALQALETYADRFADHLRELAEQEADADRRAEFEQLALICSQVPRHPARTFHQALQSLLFLQIALCTESFENAISPGRLDQMLQPYFQADLAAGRLDYESARELLACFILKFDEVVFINDGDTGLELGKIFESLSPVETVTIGGVDRQGADATNDVSYMILDICELTPIGVNMAARIHPQSPAEYLERIASVYLGGSPMPALYNDRAYLPALLREYPTTVEDARNYAIVGCVEPVASDDHFANTDAANVNLALPFLQALTGEMTRLWNRSGGLQVERRLRGALGLASRGQPNSMDQLLTRFGERLDELVRDVLADQQQIERALSSTLPTPLASSLFRGCVARGKDLYDGGATFNSSGIQALGVTDVADSLLALEQVVFEQRRHSLAEVIAALETNFEGERNQAIRQALLAAPKFGNDACAEAPRWVERVMQRFVEALRGTEHPNRNGKYVAGYYGLNANKEYGKKTPALPSGRLAGVPLANSICPHFGMQQSELTSALNAVAAIDFARLAPNGTTLTSSIDSGLFPGEEGITNLAGLIRGFFDQGGMQFQPNLVDRELLLDAYHNPGSHPELVVRIAGYCAYFDDLSDELKREILERSYYDAAR